MSPTDKPTSENKEFVNPFKSGALENPGVDITESRKRSEQKLSQLKPSPSKNNSK